LSLLIFHENYRGILSQYLPFSGLVNSKDKTINQEVLVSIDEALVHLQGYYDPNVEYGVWTDYRKLDNFRRKVMYDLFLRVIKALTAAKGTLEFESEDESSDDSGSESSPETPAGFDSEVADSVAYLQKLVVNMTASVGRLASAIASGDLSASRVAYENSRYEYEQIEVFALFFIDVDSDIDARPYAFLLGEEDSGFKGFHKIERALFRDGDLQTAQDFVTQLVASTSQLATVIQDAGNFDVVGSFEGMIGLAIEVAAKKISGEEETFSDLSNLIFEMNWKGIQYLFAPYAARPDINGTAVGQAIEATFLDINDLVSRIRSNASFPVAFKGSSTPSFRALASETFLEEMVAVSYRLAELLVEAAEKLGIFLDEENPFHKNSFFAYKRYG
jgi:iron uptake system component EfeO